MKKQLFLCIFFIIAVFIKAQTISDREPLTDEKISQILDKARKGGTQEWEIDIKRKLLIEEKNHPAVNQKTVPPHVNATSCVNPGFEDGTTNGWTFYKGTTPATLGNLPCNTCPSTPGGIEWVVNTTGTFGSCTQDNTGTDYYSGQPAVSPSGGNDALLLNNACAGSKMQKAVYSFVVSPSTNIFIFQYSVVLQSGGHPVNEQPYFHVDATDVTANAIIPCTEYDATAPTSGSLNGWSVSSHDASVYTYPWTSVALDLSAPAYSGHTIQVSFIVSDCDQGGHFGYAYIDADCSSNIITVAKGLCTPSGGPGILQGPGGFATYSWVNSSNTVVGTSQNLTTSTAGTYTLNTTSATGCPSPSMFATLTASPDPTPAFSGSVAPCSAALTFTDASTIPSGSIVNWQWNWGDNSPIVNAASGATQNHTYVPGTYTVTLTDSTNGGCVATYTAQVIANGGDPTPAFSSNSPPTAPQCFLGNNVQFTNTSTAATATVTGYQWDFGDGSTGTSTVASPNTSHSYTMCGTYVVTLTVNTTSCNAQITQTVVINPSPTASFTVPPVCQGTASSFTSLVSSAPCTSATYTYSWSFGDAGPGTSALANPTYTYPTSVGSPFAVSLTVTAVGGCSVTAVGTATVNPSPTASFSVAPVCQGTSSVFDASASTPAGSITSYSWSFGGSAPNTDNVTVPTDNHLYTTSNTFPVTLTVTAVGGCTATTTANAVVSPMPTIHITADHPCDGVGMNFTNLTANQASFNNWDFDYGDGSIHYTSINNGTIPAHTYTSGTGFAAGCYPAVLSATTTAGCSGSFDTTVYVHPLAIPYFTAFEACLGTASDFIDSSFVLNPACITDHITSWHWDFGDGQTSTSSLMYPDTIQHTYAACGPYNITLTVTTNNNCSLSATLTGDTVFCLPTVAVVPDFTVCPGAATPVINFNTICANGGTPFTQWYQSLTNVNNTGAPSTYTSTGGFDQVPSYNAIAQNLSCNLLVDSIFAIAYSGVGCPGNIIFYKEQVYPTPIIHQMVNDSICANQNLTVANFTACPVGSTFAWTNTNPAIGLAANGNGNINPFTPTNPTDAVISGLIDVIPTANGCIGPDSTFTIFVKPLPTLTATSFSTCPNTQVPSPTIVTDPAVAVTYNWTATNNIAVGMPANGSGLPAAYNAPANNSLTNQVGVITYTPTLDGCVGTASTSSITIYPTPVVTPMANRFYCPGTSVLATSFSCTPAGGTPTFNYITSGGIVFNGTDSLPSFVTQNPACSPLVTVVTVTATLNNCPSLPSSFSITIQPNPTPDFSYVGACEGKKTDFTDMSSVCGGLAIASWQWDMDNNGTIDTVAQNPPYTIHPAGTDSVKLIVTTNSNPACSASVTKPVIVYPNPTANFAGSNLKGCPPVTPTFTDQSTVATGIIAGWSWNFGDGHSSTAGSTVSETYNYLSHTQPKAYTVSLTVTTDKGCTASFGINNYVEVYPVPLAGFSWSPPDADITAPTIMFNNTSIGANTYTPTLQYGPVGVMYNLGDTYAADASSNIAYSNGIFNHLYADPDYSDVAESYWATQWVINGYGCTDSTQEEITIQPIVTFYIPNAFSPNGDGINEGFKGTGIGIKDSTYNLWVFDRWGLMIYHATGLEQSWNGRMHGDVTKQLLQEDVYVWKVKFNDILNKSHDYNGIVTLIK